MNLRQKHYVSDIRTEVEDAHEYMHDLLHYETIHTHTHTHTHMHTNTRMHTHTNTHTTKPTSRDQELPGRDLS